MATNKLLWSSKLIGVFFIMLVCTLSANAQFYVLPISWKVLTIVNN